MRFLRPVRVTPPAAPLVTLEEAKAQCRVDDGEEDGLIQRLIATATAHLDGWSGILGRCLVNQEWRQGLSGWPSGGGVYLPFPDVSAAQVAYLDEAGEEQPLDAGRVQLAEDTRGAYLRFTGSLPAVSREQAAPVQVTFTAGYGPAAEDVPEGIRHAALLLIGHWHEARQAVVTGTIATEMPLAVKDLLAPHMRVRV